MDLSCSKLFIENPIKLKKPNIKIVCSKQFFYMRSVGKAVAILDKELRQVRSALPTALKISLVPIKNFRYFEFSSHFVQSVLCYPGDKDDGLVQKHFTISRKLTRPASCAIASVTNWDHLDAARKERPESRRSTSSLTG